MAVLVYTENHGGKFKKAALEAVTYATDLAQSLGLPCIAVSVGPVEDAELKLLGKYGASKVQHIQHDKLATFNEAVYASTIASVATQLNATAVVIAQTYNGRSVGPRLAVKLGAAYFSGVTGMVQKVGSGYSVKRMAYTSKAIEELATTHPKFVVSVKSNAYKVSESPVDAAIEATSYSPNDFDFALVSKEIKKASDKIPLTEADIVVSAGRGLGNEQTFAKNWEEIGQLADQLGAATACSKPIGDLHWRPHHEHVGQTGVQISPNVYIAVGISGAIQHLAGVSSSKTIIVINKDPEAPFFKAADYGIVADAMDVLPKLNDAIQAYKAKH